MVKEKPKDDRVTYRMDSEIDKLIVDYTKLTGESKIGYLKRLVKQDLEDKSLSPFYLKLKKPLYFNLNDLLNGTKKEVEAIEEIPSSDINQHQIIYYVPTTLDKWNKDYNTYCYDSEFQHKGIVPYFSRTKPIKDFDDVLSTAGVRLDYLIFNYNLKDNKLTIGLIEKSEIGTLLSKVLYNSPKLLNKFQDLEKKVSKKINEIFNSFDGSDNLLDETIDYQIIDYYNVACNHHLFFSITFKKNLYENWESILSNNPSLREFFNYE